MYIENVDATKANCSIVGYPIDSIISGGAKFVFTDGGTFCILRDGKGYSIGNYKLSDDRKKITISTIRVDEVYELSENGSEITLKLGAGSAVSNLRKE